MKLTHKLTTFGVGFLFACTELLAQEAAPTAPAQPGLLEILPKMVPMFLMVFGIFYLMVLQPQKAKLQQQKKLLGELKPGDMVVTTGGIIGKVAANKPDHVLLEIASNVKIKVEPAHIVKPVEKEAASEKA